MSTPPIDPSELDAHVQGAVLSLLLSTYPAWHSEDELVRAVLAGALDRAARDGVLRAIRDLACDGVLHRNGRFVLPTRATVRCRSLLDPSAGPLG